MEAFFFKKGVEMPVIIDLYNGYYKIQRICNGFEAWRSFSIDDRIVEEPIFDIVPDNNLYIEALLDFEIVHICKILSQKPVIQTK